MEYVNTEKLKELCEKALDLPLSPGVYIMKDKSGKVIYVGKSKALKNRVSQYFREGTRHDIKTTRMVSNVNSFDYMLTDTEAEALTLENSLIKLHMPKFNIRLKDSKTYPYIKVTMDEPYPRMLVVRKRLNDKASYFGPYSGAGVAYSIIKSIQKVFRTAACNKEFPRDIGKSRPCLYMQIGRCMGPCTGKISSEQYREVFKDIQPILRGSFGSVKRALTEKMEYAAENLLFEQAASYRDSINMLNKLWEKQKVVGAPGGEYDVISYYTDEISSCISVFYVRDGSVADSENFNFPAEQIVNAETVTAFLTDLYSKREYIPSDILLGFEAGEENIGFLTEYLSSRAERKIGVRVPKIGEANALCKLVYENARQRAEAYRAESEKDNKVLVKLASSLSLEVVPERIEAYDISNYGSDNITGGRITVVDGKFSKKDYRIYNIQSKKQQDDYAAMCEVIERRMGHPEDSYPDLILLDGGKGHVSAVRAAMERLGFGEIPVYGMVKDEYHKTRSLTGPDEEISIAREQSLFVFVYKIQEEVHRFTISKMKAAKSKSVTTSSLEKIKGIGPAKARELLKSLGSLTAVKNASSEQLTAVKGISASDAANIAEYFSKKDKNSEK